MNNFWTIVKFVDRCPRAKLLWVYRISDKAGHTVYTKNKPLVKKLRKNKNFNIELKLICKMY